jgi:SNF2 family DNA or RNA helicase
MKDLPPVRKSNHFFNLEKEFADVYEAYVEEFTKYFDETKDTGFALFSNLLGYFAKMRHLTGRAKTGIVVDYVKDFLIANDGYSMTDDGFEKISEPKKITIFCHHKDVAEGIQLLLNAEMQDIPNCSPCLMYNSSLDAEARNKMIEKFRDDSSCRVMIASLLAAGEGLNLQFCSDSMLVERHWNHQKEEQAVVGRFHRPGQKESVNANYVIALGTIDEWISQLVARKELIVKEANEGEEQNFSEHKVLVELAEKIATMRNNKPWRSARSCFRAKLAAV